MLNDQNKQTLQWCSIIFAGLLIDTVTFDCKIESKPLQWNSHSLHRAISPYCYVMSFESVSIVHCTILYYILYYPTFWQWKSFVPFSNYPTFWQWKSFVPCSNYPRFWQWKSFVAFSNQRWLGKSRTGGVDAKIIFIMILESKSSMLDFPASYVQLCLITSGDLNGWSFLLESRLPSLGSLDSPGAILRAMNEYSPYASWEYLPTFTPSMDLNGPNGF